MSLGLGEGEIENKDILSEYKMFLPKIILKLCNRYDGVKKVVGAYSKTVNVKVPVK